MRWLHSIRPRAMVLQILVGLLIGALLAQLLLAIASMTLAQLLTIARWLWLFGGIAAVLLSGWVLDQAREDHAAHIRDSGNGAVLHAGRWRIVAATQEFIKAVTLTIAASLALFDAFDPNPDRFGLVVLLLLAIWPLEFVTKLATDAYNHQRLLDLITTEPGSPEHRKMDEHTVSDRVER